MREEFEKWLKNQIWTCDKQPSDSDIEYMYIGWKAAFSKQEDIIPAGMFETPEETDDYAVGWNDCRQMMIENIEEVSGGE